MSFDQTRSFPLAQTGRKHGTRSRYVAGCRCDDCKAANTAAYHQRKAKAKAAAAELDVKAHEPCPQEHTAPDGTKKTRMYKRACPGVEGRPCPARSHLRIDSVGGICAKCREALIWNGLVPAMRARKHLLKLSSAGVGRRSVADASDVGLTTLQRIRSGDKLKIRKNIERAILAIDEGAVAGAGLVDAAPTWKLLRSLLREGFTAETLSHRLGHKAHHLHFGKKKVLARTALKVARFHRMIMEGEEEESAGCVECGESHDTANRAAVLRRLLPMKSETIRQRRRCLWGGDSGMRMLSRDLKLLGASRDEGGEWSIPEEKRLEALDS